MTFDYRLVYVDEVLCQQRRSVKKIVYAKKWWKPWEYSIDYDYGEWCTIPIEKIYTFRRGDRVRVTQSASFHKGAIGVVEFVQPSGKVWVLRDNSGSPVYYHADELELIWRRPKECGDEK